MDNKWIGVEMATARLIGPCYESTRAPTQKYPGVSVKYGHKHYRMVGMHRIVWMFANGPIPDGMYVLHHCDNMRCVHLPHLYLGDHDQNMKDMTKRGRHRNQVKTHCPCGHPLDGLRTSGVRYCKTCDRAYQRSRAEWHAEYKRQRRAQGLGRSS